MTCGSGLGHCQPDEGGVLPVGLSYAGFWLLIMAKRGSNSPFQQRFAMINNFGERNDTSRPIYPTRSLSYTVIAPLLLTFALNRATGR
jgi:hypothetical protein